MHYFTQKLYAIIHLLRKNVIYTQIFGISKHLGVYFVDYERSSLAQVILRKNSLYTQQFIFYARMFYIRKYLVFQSTLGFIS
jgi:hypothetical protein